MQAFLVPLKERTTQINIFRSRLQITPCTCGCSTPAIRHHLSEGYRLLQMRFGYAGIDIRMSLQICSTLVVRCCDTSLWAIPVMNQPLAKWCVWAAAAIGEPGFANHTNDRLGIRGTQLFQQPISNVAQMLEAQVSQTTAQYKESIICIWSASYLDGHSLSVAQELTIGSPPGTKLHMKLLKLPNSFCALITHLSTQTTHFSSHGNNVLTGVLHWCLVCSKCYDQCDVLPDWLNALGQKCDNMILKIKPVLKKLCGQWIHCWLAMVLSRHMNERE